MRHKHQATSRPIQRGLTREEYYTLADDGYFDGERVELLHGRIITIPAMKNPHCMSVSLTEDILRTVFVGACWVRVQMPLDLTRTSAPEPDLAVVQGRIRDYSDNPTTALLVVEVAETTLDYDRRYKKPLYARVGIPEFWIVNLVSRQLEVYRDPQPVAGKKKRVTYTVTLTLNETDSISPLAAPQATILVADLLP